MAVRITVIDDDKTVRKSLASSLENRGYEVFSADYTGITVAQLAEHQPEIIILDFSLQNEGASWNLMQLLKMTEATAKIPILITTTVHLSAEIRNFLLTHYIHIVRKPYDFDTFVLRIQETLRLAGLAGLILTNNRQLPILVVDDNDELRDTITTVLDLEGYQFGSADNGLVALNALSQTEYCLILLDISMPIMNGFEFLAVYKHQLRPHVPVIILSAEMDIQRSVLPAFVVDVVPKPYDIKHLLKLIEKYAQPVF